MSRATKEKWDTKESGELFEAIRSLASVAETRAFLRDLLTESEIVEFANRWKVVRLLDEEVPYVTIEKETGMSSTTIARIKRWMREGTGGYAAMLAKTRRTKTKQSPKTTTSHHHSRLFREEIGCG